MAAEPDDRQVFGPQKNHRPLSTDAEAGHAHLSFFRKYLFPNCSLLRTGAPDTIVGTAG